MTVATTRPASTTTPLCDSCGADEMGCSVKLGLSGRRCCGECTDSAHQGVRESLDEKKMINPAVSELSPT